MPIFSEGSFADLVENTPQPFQKSLSLWLPGVCLALTASGYCALKE